MQNVFSSTLLLTILLGIGLIFFLRAGSKDRTTDLEIFSPLPPIEVLDGIILWLEGRGWKRDGGDADRQFLRFIGNVSSSPILAIFLSVLGGLGAGCLGLVLSQIFPSLGWWPLLLAVIGSPATGIIYNRRSARIESLELRLLNESNEENTIFRIRAHRDELIAMELELAEKLKLSSDGSLLTSPI